MRTRTADAVAVLIAILSIGFLAMTLVSYFRGKDMLPPIIEMDSPEIEVSISDPKSQVMAGVKAVDSKDGDVTDKMMIRKISDFNEDMKRRIDFIAFDGDGNYSEAQRVLSYSDYEPIKFEIRKPLVFPQGVSDTDVLASLSAWDCLDGDLSGSVSFTNDSMINNMMPGKYKVCATVSNSAGDSAQLPLTVEIENSMLSGIAPKIRLKKNLIYLPLGEKPDLIGLIDGVTYRGADYAITDEEGTFGVDVSDRSKYERELFKERDPAVNKDRFEITSYVNSQVPGTYEATYELTDPDGNTGSAILTVVISDDE